MKNIRKITYRDGKSDMNERRGHKVLRGFGGMLPQEIPWVSESFRPDVGLIPFSSDKALQIGGLFHLSISTASNFIALIPSRLIRQILGNYFGVEF